MKAPKHLSGRTLVGAAFAIFPLVVSAAETELSVVCPANAPGQLLVDGVAVGTCPAAISLSAGSYAVTVSFAGGGQWSATVDLEPGKRKTVFARPSPTSAAPPQASVPPQPRPAPMHASAPERADRLPSPGPTQVPPSPPAEAGPPPVINETDGEMTWVRPREGAERIPWNRHDPWQDWGDSWGTTFLVEPLVATGSSFDGLMRLGFELAGPSGLALFVGTAETGRDSESSLELGIGMTHFNGGILYDAGLPDVAFGYLWPSVDFRVALGASRFGSVNARLAGVGATFLDVGRIGLMLDASLLVAMFDDKVVFTWGLGPTIALGVAF